MKKILSMLVVGALAVGIFPVSAMAQTEGTLTDAVSQTVMEQFAVSGSQQAVGFSLEADTSTYDLMDSVWGENESNDSMAEADYLESEYIVSATLSDSMDNDYYGFVLEDDCDIWVYAASYLESFGYMLLDDTGNVINASEHMGYDAENACWVDELYISLEAGDYYLCFRDLNVEDPMEYAFYFSVVDEEEVIPEVVRISGKDRYATSDKIIYSFMDELEMEKLDTLIIASGTKFPDALAGSYLASTIGAPILLTNGELNLEWFEANVYDDALIYILGGTGAVPATVEKTLKDYDVIRLSGKTRYDTNMEILKEALSLDGYTDEILICTGDKFADSLSASATGLPILLVGNELTESQKAFLNTFSKSDFYVIGGEGAVNAKVYNAVDKIGDVERISGKTRYETSVKIAETFFLWPEEAVLAYAENFPDGLCGGPLAMSMFDTPLILTMTGKEAAAKAYAEEYDIHSGCILGGSKLISDASAKKIFGLTDTEVKTYDASAYTDVASKGTKQPVENSGNSGSGYDSTVVEGIFITPTGSRYHYLRDCAGKNAIETTLDYATKHGYTGCKTCVY